MPGVPAGSFVVAVNTIGGIQSQTIGTQVVWGPHAHKTYFPHGGTVAEASTLTLGSDDERADVDFVVPAAQATTQPFSVSNGGFRTGLVVSPFAISVLRTGTGVIRGRFVATDRRPPARAQVGLILAGTARPAQVSHAG